MGAATNGLAEPLGESGPEGLAEGLAETTGAEYTVAEVQAATGLHPQTLRKWIKAGRLRARQVHGQKGPEWRVPLAEVHRLAATHRVPTGDSPGAAPDSPSGSPNGAGGSPTDSASDSPGGTTLAVRRAEEMAAYTGRLLAPLQARLEAQAEALGRMEAAAATLREEAAAAVGELAREREARAAAEAQAAELRGEVTGLRAGLEAAAQRRPWWRFWDAGRVRV
jgi:excisionase family DNA binding protein